MPRDSIFYALSKPDYTSLVSVSLKYNCDGYSREGPRQMHIYKARELIFSEDRVIAIPVLEPPYSILAIMQMELLGSNSFKLLLEYMKLNVCSMHRVVPEQYLSCLEYTVLAVAAPEWNRVGNLLCGGRDFLVATGILPAFEWEVVVVDSESHLILTASAIRMEQMTLSHLLGVSTVDPVLHERLHVSEVPIRPVPCYVLPSMKTARAIAVSFTPFPDCPYSSFSDVKLYWRNTYGYHIPDDTEQTMVYVKVHFRANSDRFYMYPILCVRPKPPEPVPRIDPRPMIGDFVHCVKLRMDKLRNVATCGLAEPTTVLHWTAKDAKVAIDEVSCAPGRGSGRVPYRTAVSCEARPTANFLGNIRTNVGSHQACRTMELNKPFIPASKTVPCFQPNQSRFNVMNAAAGRNLGPSVASGSKHTNSWPTCLGQGKAASAEWLIPDEPLAKELPRGHSEHYQPAVASGSKPAHGWLIPLGEKKTAAGPIPDELPSKERPWGHSQRYQPAVASGSKQCYQPAVASGSKLTHGWPTPLGEKTTAAGPIPDELPSKELPRGHSKRYQPVVASGSKQRYQPAVASGSKPAHCFLTPLEEKKTTAGPIPNELPSKKLPQGHSEHYQPAVASGSKPAHGWPNPLGEKTTAAGPIPDELPSKELPRGHSERYQPAVASGLKRENICTTRLGEKEGLPSKVARWLNSIEHPEKELPRGRFECSQPAFESDSEGEDSLPPHLEKEEAPFSKVIRWLNSIECPPKALPRGHSESSQPAAVAASGQKPEDSRPATLKEQPLPKVVKWQLHPVEPPVNNPLRRRPESGQPTYAAMMAQQKMLASLNKQEAPERSTVSTAAWRADDVSRRQSLESAMYGPPSATITRPVLKTYARRADVLNTHGAVPKTVPAFNSAHVVRQHLQDPGTTQWPHNNQQAPFQHPATRMKQRASVPAMMSGIQETTLCHRASLQSAAIAFAYKGIPAHSTQREMTSSSCVSNVDRKGAALQPTTTRMRSALSPLHGSQQEGCTTGQQENTRGHWTISEVDRLVKEKKFDELGTVHTSVLLAWLCNKRIPCGIKNRSSDVLFKVIQHAKGN